MNPFKKMFSTLLASVLLLFAGAAPTAFGQNEYTYRTVQAANYSKWRAKLQNSVTSGSAVLTVSPCHFTVNAPGPTLAPFSVFAPITISGPGNTTETVVPSAVSSVSTGAGLPNGETCSITATLSNAHAIGSFVTSGSGGIAEAAAAVKNGVVEVTGNSAPNVIISSANLPPQNAFVVIRDDHVAGSPQYYKVGPSTTTLLAAPAQPTNTTGTGGLSSGQYITSAEYVDMLGNRTLPATDSAQSASTTQITEASPASATGAYAWIPMITAAGGSNGTEIEVTVTSTVCTVVVTPAGNACKIGSAALITANPSGTSKEVAFGTAHTTFAWLPVSSAPLVGPNGAFQTTYAPFAAVASIAGSANADVAQFYVPNIFNYLGRTVDICFKATGTNAGTAVPTWTLKAAKFLGQSPVSLNSTGSGGTFTTQTGAVTTNGCFKLQVTATGASGTFMVSFNALEAIQSTGAVLSGMDVNAAASSAVDLTGNGLWFQLNLAMGTAGVTGVTVNSVTIRADGSA